MEETKKKRGRPRLQYTIDRDTKVLEAVEKITLQTRVEIANRTGYTANEVYASLQRLRIAGKIKAIQQAQRLLWYRVNGN